MVSHWQTGDKICKYKNFLSSLFILDKRKRKALYLKYNNGRLGVEEVIVTFLYTVATEDVLTANNNDVLMS